MRESVEREVKLVPGDGFRLPELGPPLPARTFVSTYHDTRDLRLARHGVTLRHRLEDGARLWQLKFPHGAARIELEEAGPPAKPPASFLELLVAHLRGAELVRVARLRTRRQGVRTDGADIVEDSVSVYDGPRVTARFRELEVELVDGDEETLRGLEKALREAGAELDVFRPKLYRVLDIAYPSERAPLEPGAPPLDVLAMAISDQYRVLLAHDPGTRLGNDPEDLHQMRVATRRARAYLRAARPLLDADWAGKLRARLGWLGRALGPARDLDVLLERIRSDVTAESDADAVRSLLDGLRRERLEARRAAVSALADPRYFRLLDRLESPRPKPATGSKQSLAKLWWDEFRRTRRTFARLGPRSRDEELHAARIDVKRARYAAELAAGELGTRGERFIASAKRLQDVLGEHQDSYVASARISEWAEREADRQAAADSLLARERQRRAKAREAWPAAWATLERRARKARP
ncbi:MAG: CHAD domain-containing protein [Gaiellaceae bacterium]